MGAKYQVATYKDGLGPFTVSVLRTAAGDVLIQGQGEDPSRGGPCYSVTIIVGGGAFEQRELYGSLVAAQAAGIAQLQSVVTRANAQIRCALVDLNRRIDAGEALDAPTRHHTQEAAGNDE